MCRIGRNVWDDEFDPRAVETCRRTLESHADLSQYSTENAAGDVDAVRAALGYDQIDIWALSYGTELAQAYLKKYSAHVHAAALVGFEPLDLRQPLFHANNAERVLDLLFYGERRTNCTFVSIAGLGNGPFDLDRWPEGECSIGSRRRFSPVRRAWTPRASRACDRQRSSDL